MKILLIEDDIRLSKHMKRQLEGESFAVDAASSAEDGMFQATEFPYDCIVLDINLPDGNGFALCKELRKRKDTTPVLIVTARDATSDKITGLNLGADDYLPKPIDTQELIARVRALIRRSGKEPLPVLQVGNITVNPQTHEVFVRTAKKSVPLSLSSKEFAVLEFLARHSNEVVTRTMLMEHVWGSDFETFSNVIDVYIRNLRRKIEKHQKKKLLHTIRGSGYSFSDTRS